MRHVVVPSVVAILLATGSGCRHRPAHTAPAASALEEDYCWWTILRTTLPPDTVAARFATAFTAVGLAGAAWTHAGDTARAQAGPTPLDRPPAGVAWAARAVAYRQGDTTRFRYYTAAALPVGGRARASDLTRLGGSMIPLCGDIARATGLRWTAAPSPGAVESLSVWRATP